MAWTYEQRSGRLFNPKGVLFSVGYSGHGEGRNNPLFESVHEIGVIPAGLWHIGALIVDGGHLGPHIMALTPVGHDAHGRTAFFAHGDNPGHDASHGCVILGRLIRDAMAASPDRDFLVIEGTPL